MAVHLSQQSEYSALLELVKSKHVLWLQEEWLPDWEQQIKDLHRQNPTSAGRAAQRIRICDELLWTLVRHEIQCYADIAKMWPDAGMFSEIRLKEFRELVMTSVRNFLSSVEDRNEQDRMAAGDLPKQALPQDARYFQVETRLSSLVTAQLRVLESEGKLLAFRTAESYNYEFDAALKAGQEALDRSRKVRGSAPAPSGEFNLLGKTEEACPKPRPEDPQQSDHSRDVSTALGTAMGAVTQSASALSSEEGERVSGDNTIEVAVKLFEENPNFPFVQVRMRERMESVKQESRKDALSRGGKAWLEYILSLLDIRAESFLELVFDITTQNAFIVMLGEFARVAWQEYTGWPIEICQPASSDAEGDLRAIHERVRKWTTDGYRRLTLNETATTGAEAVLTGNGPGGNGEKRRAARWQEIEITFVSEERIRITIGSQVDTRNYSEFGFDFKPFALATLADAFGSGKDLNARSFQQIYYGGGVHRLECLQFLDSGNSNAKRTARHVQFIKQDRNGVILSGHTVNVVV